MAVCKLNPTISGQRSEDKILATNCTRIMHYITTEKPYLKDDFSVLCIASALHMRPAIISRSLNGHLKRSFFDIINHLRIEEAKHLLTQGKFHIKSIEGISQECGFRSRSTFYLAFKRYEGCTPTEWLKKMSV